MRGATEGNDGEKKRVMSDRGFRCGCLSKERAGDSPVAIELSMVCREEREKDEDEQHNRNALALLRGQGRYHVTTIEIT